jgi:anti-sigma-K factor RskA
MTIDPETLAAYADGELAPDEAAKVEAAIVADPDLARQVEAHRALRAQLTAHFAPVLEAPVPDRLADLLKPKESAQVIDLAAVRRAREEERPVVETKRPRWAMGGALAASLALGLVVGRIAIPTGPVASEGGQLVARGDLARALTTQLASAQDGKDVRILLSFEARDGRYCRGFEQGATAGIACREGSDWRILRTQAGTAPRSAGAYAQAGSQTAEIMVVAQDMAAGGAFDSTAERKARDAGWTRN